MALRHNHDDIWRAIHRLEENQLSEQAEVDALTTQLGTVSADLATAQTTIQTELNELQTKITAGEPPNLEALKTAVAALDPAVQAVAALKPA